MFAQLVALWRPDEEVLLRFIGKRHRFFFWLLYDDCAQKWYVDAWSGGGKTYCIINTFCCFGSESFRRKSICKKW